MKYDDSVYLRHILDAILRIDLYLRDKDETIFKQDTLLQDGVIRQLEIIGEATKRLSKALRAKYGHVPLCFAHPSGRIGQGCAGLSEPTAIQLGASLNPSLSQPLQEDTG